MCAKEEEERSNCIQNTQKVTFEGSSRTESTNSKSESTMRVGGSSFRAKMAASGREMSKWKMSDVATSPLGINKYIDR